MKVVRTKTAVIEGWRRVNGVHSRQGMIDRLTREAGFSPLLPVTVECHGEDTVLSQPEEADLLDWWREKERYQATARHHQRLLHQHGLLVEQSLLYQEEAARLAGILAVLERSLGSSPADSMAPAIARADDPPPPETAPLDLRPMIELGNLDQATRDSIAEFREFWEGCVRQASAVSAELFNERPVAVVPRRVTMTPLAAAPTTNSYGAVSPRSMGIPLPIMQRKLVTAFRDGILNNAAIASHFDRTGSMPIEVWELIKDL